MTWLQTFQLINKKYSATTPLEAIQIPTWDDYEEGRLKTCLKLNWKTRL
jgi:hypothetical protein